MSTTARELEELRKAREEARLQAEEEKRIADEKAAVQAKKNAFLSRAAAFQQKKGPTDDDIRQEVTKNSMKRNFSRKLDKALSTATPGTNPMALELGMRGKAGNHAAPPPPPSGPCDWELITEPDQPPYYYNKVTGESTYDRPEEFSRVLPPPPPPPPQRLMGLIPPPPPKAAEAEAEAEPVQQEETPASVVIGWVYVCVDEPNPYYWNVSTNETSFEAPEGFDGTIYTEDMNPANAANNEEYSSVVTWQEVVGENGEVYYSNLVDGSVLYERPVGTTFIQVYHEDGTQVDWQYCADEEGNGYYYNLTTQESVYDAPVGTVLIVVNQAE